MKFFNRSWTELAAGARQHYMKPLCLVRIALKISSYFLTPMKYLARANR